MFGSGARRGWTNDVRNRQPPSAAARWSPVSAVSATPAELCDHSWLAVEVTPPAAP